MMQKIDLETLLAEKDAPDHSVRRELTWLKTQLITWLGITRQTIAGGAAGKIDNLLYAINGFIVFFCIAALLPVLYIYREQTWVIPFVLICPAIHFIAWRFSRSGDVSPARIKNMHLFAAVISIVPLGYIALYAAPYLGFAARDKAFLWGVPAAAGVWVVYTVVVSCLIRTENGLYCSLFVVGLVANAGLIAGRRDLAGSSCLNLMIAGGLLCLAGKARGGRYSISADRLHVTAGFFLTAAFVLLACLLMNQDYLRGVGEFEMAAVFYVVALALLPAVLKSEAVRLAGDRLKNCRVVLLAGTWLYFGFALLLRWGSAPHAMYGFLDEGIIYLPLYGLVLIALLWSFWMLHEQLVAKNGFDLNIFVYAAFILIVCLVATYFILALHFGYVAALGVAVLVLAVNARMWMRRADAAENDSGKEQLEKDVVAQNDTQSKPEGNRED